MSGSFRLMKNFQMGAKFAKIVDAKLNSAVKKFH